MIIIKLDTKNFIEIPASRIAIAPDMAMSKAVPKSGCFIIIRTGARTTMLATRMYVNFGGRGLSE